MAVYLDHATLDALRQKNPAWRLLRADHAPLVAGFLYRTFVVPNIRVMAQADIVEMLDDELFKLRAGLGEAAYPKTALDYLNEWSSDEKGWLRRFYPPNDDQPHYEPTAATEKAIAWLAGLMERSFVGTESRLLTLFGLVKQLNEGTESDTHKRLADLQRRRAEIDAEISDVEAGNALLLDDIAVKDRFQQFIQLSRELLADFREVEANFRQLDRSARERIALWEGSKGELLAGIMGERDAIAGSEQGRSFDAFWTFLMSQSRQEEFSNHLDRILQLPPVIAMQPDVRLRHVHYDWLAAGEHTQRTVAHLSQEIRRFLDDQAWLENRRIMSILHGIEANAVAVRDSQPHGSFMEIDERAADVSLDMERPLHVPSTKVAIADLAVIDGMVDMDASALFSQVIIDKEMLADHIRQSLMDVPQITIQALLETRPLRHGLAELLTYLHLAMEWKHSVIDEAAVESVQWQSADGVMRRARMPRVIFERDW